MNRRPYVAHLIVGVGLAYYGYGTHSRPTADQAALAFGRAWGWWWIATGALHAVAVLIGLFARHWTWHRLRVGWWLMLGTQSLIVVGAGARAIRDVVVDQQGGLAGLWAAIACMAAASVYAAASRLVRYADDL